MAVKENSQNLETPENIAGKQITEISLIETKK